jgi:hypothetical protein
LNRHTLERPIAKPRCGTVRREAEENWEGQVAVIGKNRVMIYGSKDDGTYVVEFMTATGAVLAISIPRNETAVLRYFQERMPYGLFVSDEPVKQKRPR